SPGRRIASSFMPPPSNFWPRISAAAGSKLPRPAQRNKGKKGERVGKGAAATRRRGPPSSGEFRHRFQPQPAPQFRQGGQQTAAGDPGGRTTVCLRLARKMVAALWRTACVVAWCLLGLWTAGALFYNVPLSTWPATLLALGVALLYASALRERFFVRGRPGVPWRATRRSLAALAVTAAVAVWYFGLMKPNPNQDWIPKHSQMPHVQIKGDKVYVRNVRDYVWRTESQKRCLSPFPALTHSLAAHLIFAFLCIRLRKEMVCP